MRTLTKAIKGLIIFPAHTWQENHSSQEIQIQPWETSVPGAPAGALHTWVPGSKSEEDPRHQSAYMPKSFRLPGLQDAP